VYFPYFIDSDLRSNDDKSGVFPGKTRISSAHLSFAFFVWIYAAALDFTFNPARTGSAEPHFAVNSIQSAPGTYMEANEIHEFSKEMHEAGASGMRQVSLIISVLAVLVAMVTVLGHRTHTEAVLMQSRAADQWNQYQAKKIRQGQLGTASDLLSLQPSSDDAAVQRKLGEYKAHIERLNGDLTEEQKKAEELEHEVNRAEHRASRYDLGEALLQIAVVLASITLLTKQRLYFGLGLVLGLAGLLTAASAILIH
jgi:hypothetical protein